MKRSALSALATALLTATIIQIGCASTTDTTKETNTPKIAEDLYISFCTTNEVKRQPETFESHVYTYGLQSGEVSEMGVVPYNSGYPLAVYSAKDKQIYYSYRENEKNWRNSPPQLYSYDPATKKATQLTDNLAGMNYIVPQKDKVILVASSIEEENLLPYVYERGKGASLVSGWNKDLGIRKLYINPNNEEAICSAYSSNERNNRFEYQTDEYPFEEPPESVYSLLGKDKV
ncbi:MAG: hypothetical protein LBO70_02575, partial [Clostridiales Family XIII bacterium]|nr:hypothetical protein [Clostridiales Family XIII bacterium]